jgi:hypothetical protein
MTTSSTTSMPRVFLVSRSERFNTQAAERFGMRTFLDVSSSVFAVDKFIDEIYDKMVHERYQPGVDYIALTGPNLEVALLCATVFGAWPDREQKLLLFDARSGYYTERRVSARVAQR